MSAKSPTVRRILREAAELTKSPAPDYTASPLDSDLFDWHFTFRGPPNSPYAEGIYHGRIVLPPLYPLRPPSFRFLTPSGRFEVNREICLSISGHHEETWQPAWGLRTALVALRSFMETDAMGQLGGLDMSKTARERLALESRSFRCPTCTKTNLEIIQACEELCKQSEGVENPVEVPSDLRMAWRDEVTAASSSSAASEQHQNAPSTAQQQGHEQQKQPPDLDPDLDPEFAELAEGYVKTTTGPPAAPVAPPLQRPENPPAVQQPRPRENIIPVQRPGDDGVPLWVDRAIVILVVALVALILRLLFSK